MNLLKFGNVLKSFRNQVLLKKLFKIIIYFEYIIMSLFENILFFFDVCRDFFEQMNSIYFLEEEPDDVEPIS